MSSTRIRNGLAVVALAVALFATLGEAQSGPATNSAPNAGQVGATSVSGGGGGGGGAGSSKTSPIPVGTHQTVAQGWDVTVNSANLDADALLAASDEFATPTAGTKFVLVNLTVSNKSDKPDEPDSNVRISMLPPSGVSIDPYSCFVTLPDKLELGAQMQPGSTATGNLCFEVKPADITNSLVLAEPVFTLDKNEDQRFFALA